jgi:hypothetical protein
MFGGGKKVEDDLEETQKGFDKNRRRKDPEGRYSERVPEITWKDVGNVALDFTPIIGDIKGGYETVKIIGEELDKENPNYYLIGAMGGLGAVGTILGLVPGAGDAAQKAILQGTKMVAEKSGQLSGELVGTARAIRDGDLEFILSRGSALDTQGIGADVVKKTKEQLDPVRLTGSSKGFYKNKAPQYVPDIEVQSTDQGLLMPTKPVTIDELQAENTDLIPLVSDRTDAGKTITGIKGGARDYTFNNPVDLQGGRGFIRYPDTGAFASMESVMQPQANEAAKIAQRGRNPKGIAMSMSPEGGDFSVNMSDTVMEMMDQSPVSAKDVREFDDWVRTNVDPNFPGMRDPSTKNYLANNLSGTRRQLIWKQLDKVAPDGETYVKKGFPVMGDARVAITDPNQLTTPNLQGTSVANFDTSGNLITGPVRIHQTYGSQIGPTGEAGYRGELEALPYEIIMRDFVENRRSGGIASSGDQRSLTMSNVSQSVDQQMVDEANEYIALVDQIERDAYRKNLSQQRQERQIYRFGDNGGPPLNDPPMETQMATAFSDELEIGTSQFNIENPNVVLKNHTIDDLEAIDLSKSTAGGPKKNAMINAPVEEGAEKSVRLNLNSKIDPDGPPAPFNRLQTVHPINSKGVPNYSKAESYLPAVTLEKGTFHVDQKKRRAIAEDGKKVPAMSVQGNFTSQRNVLNEMDDTVVEVGINPFDKHLFTDMKTGQAVKGFDIATVYRDRVYAKGVTYWKKSEAPEPLPAKGDKPLVNQVRYAFNQGGFMAPQSERLSP